MESTYALPAAGRPSAPPPLRKIAVEEHFNLLTAARGGSGQDLDGLVRGMDYDRAWSAQVGERLTEFGARRLAGMDAAGIDVAILSHTVPGVQGIPDAGEAQAAARDINDYLAGEVIPRGQGRYAGFASVALHDPAAAARELERAITTLGLAGVMINGYSLIGSTRTAEYLDAPRLLPFWEAAAALRAPVYLHPRPPPRSARLRRTRRAARRHLGLRGGNRDARAAADLPRPVRPLPLAHAGPRPPRRDAPLLRVAHPALLRIQPVRQARRAAAAGLPRRQPLRHDERPLQRPGARQRRADHRRRPHPVRGGLSL